tara:strand:+ start:283 stop:1095 length:813 start_codon:yes stop_codon:yes gene_type:complete
MKISIITPSYNQKDYIEKNIKSVLNQKYFDFEHIIVDGDSNDGTQEVLKKYDHLKWISEKDKGQCDALNKALKMVTGEVIGWLNADDFYLDGAFDQIIKFMKETNSDCLYGDYLEIDKNEIVIKENVVPSPSKWIAKYMCFIPSTTFFFKSKILKKGFEFDNDLELTMDKEFFAYIFENNFKVNKLHKFISCFRWHGKNKTTKFSDRRIYEAIKIINKYSNLKLKYNIFGKIFVFLIGNALMFYRLICRKFNIGFHRENKDIGIHERYIN